MSRRTLILLVIPAACVLAACQDSNGPSGPNVEGLWTGTFRSGPVSLNLDQSGSELTGTFTSASQVLDVTGEVAGDGTVAWASEVNTSQCSIYGAPEMQLRATGDSLVGVARRSSGAKVCDPNAPGLVLVEQGEMRLSRVSP